MLEQDKQELALIDQQIADAEQKLAHKRVQVASLESFLDQKYARRMMVEARVVRDEAPLRKPVGPCVIETMPNGDEWRV